MIYFAYSENSNLKKKEKWKRNEKIIMFQCFEKIKNKSPSIIVF